MKKLVFAILTALGCLSPVYAQDVNVPLTTLSGEHTTIAVDPAFFLATGIVLTDCIELKNGLECQGTRGGELVVVRFGIQE